MAIFHIIRVNLVYTDNPLYLCREKIFAMKRMKYIWLWLLLAVVPGACSKDGGSDLSGGEEERDTEVYHEMIVLGNKLDDPYTVDNMTKALASVYPTKAGRTDIRPSDIYVRFLPADEDQYKRLQELGVEMLDHPMDYEILREGDYYHDPSVDEDKITWQYAVVSPSFQFPEGIPYEVLDECYIPNEAVTRADDGIDWAAVERESFRLTGNENLYVPETKGEATRPEGRIMIVDDKYAEGKPFGVAGVMVSCNVFVKFASCYTDRDGYYEMPQYFSWRPRYRLVFKNKIGFGIGLNLILIPASFSTLGKGSPHGIDEIIHKDSDRKLFARCVTNNAAWDYFQRCSEEDLNLPKPPSDVRFWIFYKKDLSSAAMLKHGTVLGKGLFAKFLGEFRSIIQVFLPDITLGVSNADDYAAIYNLVVHELAHASHFTRVGVDYWDRYIEYIISSFVRSGGVVYGTGTESDSGYCEIGEMWAYYLEQKLYSDRYGGNPPSFGQEWWFFPQIFRYLDERGMTPSEIIKALDGEVASREALKAKLVSLYPGRKAIIDEVFARYTNE